MKNLSLISGVVLLLLLTSCNRNKMKFIMNGNDTIASYIHLNKENKNYIIVGKQLFNKYKPSDIYANKPILNRLLTELGIEKISYKNNTHNKRNKEPFMLYLYKNSFTDISLYNSKNYYLKIAPSLIKDELIPLKRELSFSQKNFKTTEGNDYIVFPIYDNKCIIESDTLLTTKEIQYFIDKHSLTDYHIAEFTFNNIGVKQMYACYKNDTISYISNHPTNIEEANVVGLKAELKNIKNRIDDVIYLSDTQSDDGVAQAAFKFNSAGEDFKELRDNYATSYPDLSNDFGETQSYIITKFEKYFPLMRAAYAEALKKRYWEKDIEVKLPLSIFTTRLITFESYRFVMNKNIKDFYEGVADRLCLLRFKKANFEWGDGLKATDFEIESKDDNEL